MMQVNRDDDMAKKGEPSQQEFLREAMRELGMTRAAFAARLHVSVDTLNGWMQPSDSQKFRAMSPMATGYVKDILKWEGNT